MTKETERNRGGADVLTLWFYLRWKGSKARNIGGGYKLFYGVDGKRNGVAVIMKEEYTRNVVEVK